MTVAIQKQYIYQAYSNVTGQFLGTLPNSNISSDFGYSQNINSAGCQMQITLAATLDDVNANQIDEFWLDESGNKIIDESGNHIVFSTSFNFLIPINVGNRIKVLANYDGMPSGKTVFDGIITDWTTDYVSSTITINVMSWGVQLDNFIINTNPTTLTIDQESYNTEYFVDPGDTKGGGTEYAQAFNIASPTTIGAIVVFMRGSADFYTGGTPPTFVHPISQGAWQLYSGTPSSPGSLIDTGSFSYAGATVQSVTMALTQPLSLSGNYFIHFKNYSSGTWYYGAVYLEASNANPYSGGNLWSYNQLIGVYTQINNTDLAFIVQSSTGSNQLVFTNNDPGTIVRRILDQAIAQGSKLNYNNSTVVQADTSVSYSYKTQTILEGIQRMLALAPDGYYWYVDPSTNTVYFKLLGNSADHRFVLGKHVTALNLTHSLLQVKNSVYFSGGATGGVNLYVADKNPASVAKYGQWLERIGDNRITDSAQAQTVISGELNQKSLPVFTAQVDILASDYDIETIDLGEMVNFRNFNNLIDTLLFQIVNIKRTPDKITLTLGTLLPRNSADIDELKRRLSLLETIANPASPS